MRLVIAIFHTRDGKGSLYELTDKFFNKQTEIMKAIIATIIKQAIDTGKIPDFDAFDVQYISQGSFEIILNDRHRIVVSVEVNDEFVK